jgi:hypothetical protein
MSTPSFVFTLFIDLHPFSVSIPEQQARSGSFDITTSGQNHGDPLPPYP